MIEYINIALLILMLWVTYVLLQKFSPIVSIDLASTLNKEQFEEKYFKFYRLSVIGIALGTPILTVILKWVLDKAIAFRLSFLADVVIVVPPDAALVWIGAGFLGLYLSYTIVLGICYNYLLHDWDEFLIYANDKLKFDIVVRGSYFNRFLSLFLVLFMLMLFDNFSTFGEEEIKTNSFLGLGTTKYPYANVIEVKDIAKSANIMGKLTENPYYEIVFKDNSKWSSKFSGFDSYDENTRIITLVSTKVDTYIKRLEYQ